MDANIVSARDCYWWFLTYGRKVKYREGDLWFRCISGVWSDKWYCMRYNTYPVGKKLLRWWRKYVVANE